MLDRKQSGSAGARRRRRDPQPGQPQGIAPTLRRRRVGAIPCGCPGLVLLLLCIGAISGCGALPLASLTQPRQPSPVVAHSFHATVKTLDGTFSVALDITPDQSGPNVFTVRVQNTRTDQPLEQATITLYFTMQDMLMGTDSIALRAQGNGLYSAASGDLSMAGRWAIGMTIQTPDRRIHKVGISLVTS